MKHLIRSGAVALLLLVNVAAIAGGGGETKVYITKTGHKYHRATCRYLKKSKIEVTLSEAKKRGLEPCSVCQPPVSESKPGKDHEKKAA